MMSHLSTTVFMDIPWFVRLWLYSSSSSECSADSWTVFILLRLLLHTSIQWSTFLQYLHLELFSGHAPLICNIPHFLHSLDLVFVKCVFPCVCGIMSLLTLAKYLFLIENVFFLAFKLITSPFINFSCNCDHSIFFSRTVAYQVNRKVFLVVVFTIYE